MPGLIKEQLEYTVVSDSGKLVDARTDNSKSAQKHREKLEREEARHRKVVARKERSRILQVIREARAKLKVLITKRDELRKAGNAVRKSNAVECTKLYVVAADLGPEITGLQKHLREQQSKLEVL